MALWIKKQPVMMTYSIVSDCLCNTGISSNLSGSRLSSNQTIVENRKTLNMGLETYQRLKNFGKFGVLR
jgi:hypothetical protein